jgi:hypothetical protein
VLRAVDKTKAEDRRVLFGARGGVPSDGLLQGGKVRLRDFRTAKTRGRAVAEGQDPIGKERTSEEGTDCSARQNVLTSAVLLIRLY